MYVDVIYDGKWIFVIIDMYMIFISIMFKDKDGKMKMGFSGWMGGKIVVFWFLKLNFIDVYNVGKGYKFYGG